MQVATRTLPPQDRGTAAASQPRAPELGAERASSSPQAGKSGSGLGCVLGFPRGSASSLAPSRKSPHSLAFSSGCHSTLGTGTALDRHDLSFFFKVYLDHQQGVPRLPKRRLLKPQLAFSLKKKSVIVGGGRGQYFEVVN